MRLLVLEDGPSCSSEACRSARMARADGCVFERRRCRAGGKNSALRLSMVIDKSRTMPADSTLAQFDHSLCGCGNPRTIVAIFSCDAPTCPYPDIIRHYAGDSASVAAWNREIECIDLGIHQMQFQANALWPRRHVEHEGLQPMPWKPKATARAISSSTSSDLASTNGGVAGGR